MVMRLPTGLSVKHPLSIDPFSLFASGSGVAQFIERSLPTPEVRGSNTVIGKFFMNFLSTI